MWKNDSIENITLRDYQIEQLNFIEKKLPGGLPIAIQSPTGSGKTYMFLSFVKKYFEKHQGEDKTIVITTGFNNLVFQLNKVAKEVFNLNPIVYIGRASAACGLDIMKAKKLKTFPEYNGNAFTQNPEYKVNPKNCRKCLYKKDCFYSLALKDIKAIGPKLIITNHSSYLLALESGLISPDIAIVDESHTFAQFYEGFLKTELSAVDIADIQKIIEDAHSPISSVFKRVMENDNPLAPKMAEKIKEKLVESNNPKRFQLSESLMSISNAKPAIDNFISISKNGFELTRFWGSYEVKQDSIKYILVSATQDEFTLTMFGVMRSRIYREYKCNTINYKDSDFLVVPYSDFIKSLEIFIKDMAKRNYSRGLILSTSNKNVNDISKNKDFCGFRVFTELDSFENYKDGPCFLIGSRKFFQGVDILNLDFVAVNTIPFPRYDEKFKKQAQYLEKVHGINAWTKFTVPQVKNDMLQSTGRLWRQSGDKGVIAVFDERLLNRFQYMIKYIEESRRGINVHFLLEDGIVDSIKEAKDRK